MRRFERLARDLGSAAVEAGRLGNGLGTVDPAKATAPDVAARERRLRRLEARPTAPAGPSPMTGTEFRALGGLDR